MLKCRPVSVSLKISVTARISLLHFMTCFRRPSNMAPQCFVLLTKCHTIVQHADSFLFRSDTESQLMLFLFTAFFRGSANQASANCLYSSSSLMNEKMLRSQLQLIIFEGKQRMESIFIIVGLCLILDTIFSPFFRIKSKLRFHVIVLENISAFLFTSALHVTQLATSTQANS